MNKNIKFLKNSFITIVGETGSGKSALINLLLKLYQVPNNNIIVDNTDLNNIQINNIRDKIRIMSQDGFLNDTIKNNIDLNNMLHDIEIKNYAEKQSSQIY